MRDIVVATTNVNKVKRIQLLLKDLNYNVISLKEAGINLENIEEPKETKSTPVEIAMEKAIYYAKFLPINTIVLSQDDTIQFEGISPEDNPGLHIKAPVIKKYGKFTDEYAAEYYKNLATKYGGSIPIKFKYVIQVKFYNNPVGNKAVQEVVGAIGMYKADKGIVVTNSTFTPSAIELAQANNIELVNGESIEKYKKEILQDVQPIDDEEQYVQKVLDISKEISEDEQLSNDTKMSIEKTFANIGKAFCLEKSQSNKSYNDDDINNFLKMLWEKGEFYDSEGNLLLISDQKDTLEILIRAGIYIMEFFPKVNVILETIVDDNEKMKQIYYEYIDENEDNLFKADRVFALSIMFETDVEEITETINFFYNEKYGISTTDEEDTFDNFDDDNDNLFYE